MVKILITSVISFGIGAGITYSLLSDERQRLTEYDQQSAEQLEGSAPSTSVYTDYILQLENINRNLNRELESLRAASAGLSDKPKDDSPQPMAGVADFEAYYNARKNSEEFSQYLQSVSGGNGIGYTTDLASKFNAETVDTQWAQGYEQRLYRLFESELMTGNFVPQSVQCKSRRCQIKIAIANIDQANEAMQEFSEALNNNQLAIDKSMVVSAPDMNEGVVNLYVARDENVKIYE